MNPLNNGCGYSGGCYLHSKGRITLFLDPFTSPLSVEKVTIALNGTLSIIRITISFCFHCEQHFRSNVLVLKAPFVIGLFNSDPLVFTMTLMHTVLYMIIGTLSFYCLLACSFHRLSGDGLRGQQPQ